MTPGDATAYADRGYFYMRRGRYRDALGDFVTGSRLDPQNPLYLYAAARSLVAAGDLDGAVAFYTELIKAGPREGKLYLARAEAEVRLQRWPEALADYERAEVSVLPQPRRTISFSPDVVSSHSSSRITRPRSLILTPPSRSTPTRSMC